MKLPSRVMLALWVSGLLMGWSARELLSETIEADGTGVPGDFNCKHYVFGLQPDTTYVVYAGVDSSLVYHLRSGPAGDFAFGSGSPSPVWISLE